MNTKNKNTTNKNTKSIKSSFNTPAIGSLVPKDAKMVKHANGTISFVSPSDSKINSKKKKK